MTTHAQPAPVGVRFFTPGVMALIGLVGMGLAAAAYRFIFGLQAATNLTDQYPWGIWIAIDVATGVALAAGGFTTAALAHIFQRHRYEAVVRPALLTAMLGYTFVSIGLLADLGRYYNIWHPMVPTMWQGNSVLFEVGMCVTIYLHVLYIEFMPLVCERFIGRVNLPGPLAAFNGKVDALLRFAQSILGKVMFLFVIAGVVLSCMHQSSLGALLLIAPYKMHPLWYTPVLPMLFLMSAIAVGFPMVVFESMFAGWAFKRKPEMHILTPLSRFMVLFLGIYTSAKIIDLMLREAYVHLADGTVASTMYIIEILFGLLLPLAMLMSNRVRRNPALLFLASTLVVLGVALNRINVFLVAYTPPFATAPYFPSLVEIMITVGAISGLILAYRVCVTIFPVLPAEVAFDQHATLLPPACGGIEGGRKGSSHIPQVASTITKTLLFAAFVGWVAPVAYADDAMPGTKSTTGDCNACHSTAKPSEKDLFPRNCQREKNTDAATDSLANVPDVFVLDDLSDIYVPVVFPHKLHADMESMADGCAICHHHSPTGEMKACNTCHDGATNPDNLRQPGLKGAYHRQCLNCHREWSHDTACEECHVKKQPGVEPPVIDTNGGDIMGKLHPNVETPEKWVYNTDDLEEGSKVTFHHRDHSELFGKRCVDCHRKENCSRCHDSAAPQEKHVRQDPHEDCMKCHDTEGDCARCHQQGETPGFDHFARTGFKIDTFHAEVACKTCHGQSGSFKGMKADCTACHEKGWFPENFDHAKTGLTLDELHQMADCQSCHTGGLGKQPTCTDCHDDGRKYPEAMPGTKAS